MPIWAIVCCIIILLEGILTPLLYKIRPSYCIYIPGKILSSIFGVLFFAFYYDFYISKPESVWVVIAMVGYCFCWGIWESRFLLPQALKPGGPYSISDEPYKTNPSPYIFFFILLSVFSFVMLFIISALLLTYIN